MLYLNKVDVNGKVRSTLFSTDVSCVLPLAYEK